MHTAGEFHTIGTHQVQPTIEDVAVEFHGGNAVAHEAARQVAALHHHHLVTHLKVLVKNTKKNKKKVSFLKKSFFLKYADFGDLSGASESSRSGADDSNALPGEFVSWHGTRHVESALPAHLRDGAFNAFNGHRLRDNAEDAGAFARRRADAPSELGEVVGLQESLVGGQPLFLVHQVVPIGDEVAEGATEIRLAEGHSAVHATRCLSLEGAPHSLVRVHLRPIAKALLHWTVLGLCSWVLHEALQLVRLRHD